MLWMLILAAVVSEATALPAVAPTPTCALPDYDVAPKILQQTRPVYPTAAAVAGAEGTVIVQTTVSATGEPEDMRVVESIPALDATAIECVREWRFKPARKNGEPVRSTVWAEVSFRLGVDRKPGLSRSYIAAAKPNDGKMPKLLKRLRDDKPEVRADAAWKLSGVGDSGPEAAAALLAALDDPSSMVRDRAAVALFGMNDPAAQAALVPDNAPTFTSRRRPRYPPSLYKTVTGAVELQLLVSETGRVIHAKFDRRATPDLDTAVLAAASHWQYQPRIKDGRARPFVARAAFDVGRGYVTSRDSFTAQDCLPQTDAD